MGEVQYQRQPASQAGLRPYDPRPTDFETPSLAVYQLKPMKKAISPQDAPTPFQILRLPHNHEPSETRQAQQRVIELPRRIAFPNREACVAQRFFVGSARIVRITALQRIVLPAAFGADLPVAGAFDDRGTATGTGR